MINDTADNTAPLEDGTEGTEKPEAAEVPEADWLQIAQRSYESSTRWLDTEVRKQWERSVDHFHLKHPKGSKYHSGDFKHRSKLFRPKTRAQIRKAEAAAANAFFATVDVVNVSADDDNDPLQQASAAINKELLNYRLAKTVPWFRIVMGAYQDANVLGVCVSKQYWKKEQDDTGEYLCDEPCVELLAPENVRIDGGADWLDPVNSSPFFIHMVPVYVSDAKKRMASGEWIELDDAMLRKGQRGSGDDATGEMRDRYVGNSDNTSESIADHEIVWAHENFVRYDGKEYVYWTLGTHALLSDPKPIEEVYLHGERPFTMGYALIEAHRPFPDGKAALGSQLQMAANDQMNLRMDAVRLAMVGRPIVRAGAKEIDYGNLARYVPGQPIIVPNPETDIKWDRAPEVGQSAYEEQNRIDLDTDDLLGAFNGASVMANRQVGETVGGMQLLSGSQNAVLEYDLRVFTETWVESTLRQLMKLEQAYETNLTVLALAGKRAQLFQRFGINEITDELLKNELTLTVNVGVGATDPTAKLQRFGQAWQMAIGVVSPIVQLYGPGVMKSEGIKNIFAEIFGNAGYKDGTRFLDFETGAEQTQQQQPPPDPALIKAQIDAKVKTDELQLKREVAEADIILRSHELQGKFGLEAHKIAVRAGIEEKKMAVSMQDSAEERTLNERGKQADRIERAQDREAAKVAE